MLDQREENVGHQRFCLKLRDKFVIPGFRLDAGFDMEIAAQVATDNPQRQVVVLVGVGVAHATAIQHREVVQERGAVTRRNRIQPPEELRNPLHMVGIHFGLLRHLLWNKVVV